MSVDGVQVVTHLIVSHGDYESSQGLAAAISHIARYANQADATTFADDGVFDATERAIEALTQIRDSAKHVRGARHW
jgi:hypothetical protein